MKMIRSWIKCIDAFRFTCDRKNSPTLEKSIVDELKLDHGLRRPILKNIHSTIQLGDRLSCAETIIQGVFVYKNTKCRLRIFYSLSKVIQKNI